MYNKVQIPNDNKIPMGMSRLGFLASCAAVETASKPIYAKNTMAAALMIPENKLPELPCILGNAAYIFWVYVFPTHGDKNQYDRNLKR
jgi:hypothetical protein